MVTYNPMALAFGYYSAALRWLDSGEIFVKMAFEV